MSKKIESEIYDRDKSSALKFLMTYGWALLIVLVCLGGLAYYDFISAPLTMTERCDIICDEFDSHCLASEVKEGRYNQDFCFVYYPTLEGNAFKIVNIDKDEEVK